VAGLLGSANRRGPSLREMFNAGETVLAPGCYEEFLDFIGLPEVLELEQRFAEG
jgi:hypothetical protein